MKETPRFKNTLAPVGGLLIVVCLLMLLRLPSQAQAASNALIPTAADVQISQIEPQLVTAVIENQLCGGLPWPGTLEVWNVGALGGGSYGQALGKGDACVNDKLQKVDDTAGTFSGGPNGMLTFKFCMYSENPDNCPTLQLQFEDGKRILYQGYLYATIQNPEAFAGWYKPEATPTATEAVINCFPLISNIDDLKPGEVLSPSIDFVDEKGKPTDIIGHALFINGVETWSVVWDGKATMLEVQYTCLNHRGDSKVITIPAYQGAAAGATGGDSGAPVQPGDSSANQPGQAPAAPATTLPAIPINLPTAIGVLGLAAGLGGAAISGGAMVVSVLNTVTNRPPVPPKAPAQKPASPPDKKAAPQGKEAKKGKEKEGEKEKKEKKPERKGLLESEKEALEQYKEKLETLSDAVEKSIDLIDKISGINPDTKKRLMDELSDFKDKLGDMSDRVGDYTDKIEMIQDIQNKVKSLGDKYKQIQKAHQQAFKDMEGLPEGTANQVADLTTAIETFGDVADAALSRIPYFKHVYSDETFEVTKSFKEFGKGLRKLVKTIHRSTIEAKQVFTPEELEQFGLKPDQRLSPEMQQFYREQALKQPQAQPDSYWQKVKDFIFGKEVSPKYKSMR